MGPWSGWGSGSGKRPRPRPEQRSKSRSPSPPPVNETSINDIKIINLSHRKLNSAEILLLEKGLKFTPTPTIGNPDQVEDVQEFNRIVRLKEYFDGTEDTDKSLVKNKSNFIPPAERNEALDKFIEKIED